MADVLLTHSNHLYFDRKQVKKMQPYPPLQTLLAAAAACASAASAWRCLTQRFELLPRRVLPQRSTLIGPAWRWFAKTISTSSPRCVWDAIENLRSRWLPRRARGASPSPLTVRMRPIMSLEYLGRGLRFRLDRRSGNYAGGTGGRPAARFHSRARLSDRLFVQRNPPARTSHGFGNAPSARLGPGRYGSIPAGLAASARLLLAQHGLQPRMPVSVQLVRQADLRQSLPCALARIRRVGDALSEGQISAGPHVVRRRYFCTLAEVDPGLRGRCGTSWRAKCRSRCSPAAI